MKIKNFNIYKNSEKNKNRNSNLLALIRQFFEKCLNQVDAPKKWKIGYLVPIY